MRNMTTSDATALAAEIYAQSVARLSTYDTNNEQLTKEADFALRAADVFAKAQAAHNQKKVEP